MTSPLDLLRRTLQTEMPVSQHLGIEPASYRAGVLTLRAPLAANVNHKGTAFGGSLNAIATLACWSVLWLALREHGVAGEVVIQDSSIRYLHPVTGDFTARAGPPDQESFDKLLAAMKRRGRGRIELSAEVLVGSGVAVRFTGRYVIETPTGAG